MSFNREKIKLQVASLAAQNIFVGTSSWKYAGWCGQLYDEQRYVTRGKFAKTRFEKTCLPEYAEVFKTVCFDGAHYKFYDSAYLRSLSDQVPDDFKFGFKVADAITIKKYPLHARHGPMAGKINPDFLNPGKFADEFLKPYESIRSKVGFFMFEFSRFHSPQYEHGSEFVADLDKFLSSIPSGWPYGIELRNANWLKPEYFECLKRHDVAHVFNSWAEMPPVSEQRAILGSETSEMLSASRFLLKQGRKYQNAVDLFQPYNETKEVNEEARQAGALLIADAKKKPKKKTFIFVNNRLEGNALNTIDAMISMSEISEP